MAYFNWHYFLLRIVGLGNFHNSSEKDFRIFSNPLYNVYSAIQLGFWVFLFTIALWMEVPNIYNDLDRLMLNLTFSITFTFSFVKVYIVIVHNKSIQEIVYSLENDMCKFRQNKDILKKTIKISKQLTMSVLVFANLTVLGLVVGGTIQAVWSPKIFQHQTHNNITSFTSSDRILPMPVYIPFEISSDLVYAMVFMYQILGIQWYGNLVVLINTFMNTIMVHFAGRFANLKYAVENIRKIAILRLKMKISEEVYDMDDLEKYQNEDLEKIEQDIVEKLHNDAIEEEMYKCLRECIIHHTSIISCVEKFENVYNIGFLVHVINNLNIICHVMIQISENDLLSIRCGTAVALFFTVVSELLVQCYAGNELTLQAMGVAESAYNCMWYSTDKRFKRLLLILMMRAQKPLNVTAGKFVAVSNDTFVAIMRGAYSFYAVIRSTKGH